MSASPRWDTRNQGFVPPSQLRGNNPAPQLAMPTSEHGELAPKAQHSRTSSFFSFTSKKSAQHQAQQAVISIEQRSQPLSSPSVSGHVQVPSSASSVQSKRQTLGDSGPPSPNARVQREIKSVIDLTFAHAHKVYFSGPLVRRIERQPDGTKPARDDGWVDIWAQLGGTTLSVWDMKAIDEASKRGEEVPPSYINVTDSFIQVLGALTCPATATTPAKRYTNVITLNTAGSNLILFACPSSPALISWSASFRLAAWEKSRLEEIYTGHLLRMTLSDGDSWKEPTPTLIKGKIEGQVKVRLAGQTDWKPLWMVVSSAVESPNLGSTMSRRPTLERVISPSSTTGRARKRVSNLFSRGSDQSSLLLPGPTQPVVTLYASNKAKDLKRPLLTVRHVSQVFAVYPERIEVISRSTLFKLEGLLGEEDMAGALKGKQAWLMVMPENPQNQPVFELLRWLVALHDTFSLYGRPSGYLWDPRHPDSMWFAYPVGAQRAQLFVDRERAEALDPRDDRTTVIRKNLKQIMIQQQYSSLPSPPPNSPPIGQPIRQPSASENPAQGSRSDAAPTLPSAQSTGTNASGGFSPMLPPLNFGGVQPVQSGAGPGPQSGTTRASPVARGTSSLTPITESSPIDTHLSSTPPMADSGDRRKLSGSPPPLQNPTPAQQEPQASGKPVSEPAHNGTVLETHNAQAVKRGSEDSYTGSRPDSKLANSTSYTSDHPDDKAMSETQTAPVAQPTPEIKPLSPSTRTSYGFPSPTPNSPSLTQSTAPPSPLGPRTQSATAGFVHASRVRPQATMPEESRPSPQIRTVASPTHSRSRTSSSHAPPSPPPKTDSRSSSAAVIGQEWPQPPEIAAPPPTKPEQEHDLANEAGALYLLQQQAEQAPPRQPLRDAWTTSDDDEQEEQDEQESTSGPERNPPPRRGGTPPVLMQSQTLGASESQRNSHARSNLGRKPSGARARPGPRRYADKPSSLETFSESQADPSPPPITTMEPSQSNASQDETADALAALTFLEQEESVQPPPQPTAPTAPIVHPASPAPAEKMEPSPPPSEGHHYPSSFAPSKHAAERKAKAQAQQEATYAATHLPGKPNGKNRKKAPGAWAESSDEEDEEDEDEEEDDGSEDDAPPRVRQPQPLLASDPRVSVYPSAQPGAQSIAGDYGLRQTRTLPLPPNRTGGSPHDPQSVQTRVPSGQYDDRPRTHVGDEPRGHTLTSHQAARQSVWSTVLDPQPPPRNTSGRDTFVQVDQSETMTKAFQPQGLLSAGLQDKEDRSAKRQEEHARETGASLINVPNKPPPPQTGLLGAITAHERERKREGGVGAALTEKERERRLAEERQRKLDDLQRQQIDQLSQGGGQGTGYDIYGQQQFPAFGNFDPRMSMNPMMLNPYMGAYPMMPFGNPQQMMAAQLAAQQAYQQAMISFSQAGGSQVGDNLSRVGVPTPAAPPSPLQGGMMGSPIGTPSPIQGGMMGVDPRLSMMGPMGMMMGGGYGMNPMMGMGMGMGQNFDPRMSMAQQSNYLQRPDSGQGGASPSPRHGSPGPARSGNNSPRPQNP